MTKIYLLISLVILLFVNVCWCQCRWANWQGSFDRAGWSKCGSTTEYLTGFYRNSKSASDPIHLLDKGNCCNAPAPNQNRASTCQNANWWKQLDRFVNKCKKFRQHISSACPRHYASRRKIARGYPEVFHFLGILVSWASYGKNFRTAPSYIMLQFLDRENNDKNNTLPLGKQICSTIV